MRVNSYLLERRLRKYRSISELDDMIKRFTSDDNELNKNEQKRLLFVIKTVTGQLFPPEVGKSIEEVVTDWWSSNYNKGKLVSSTKNRFGVEWVTH